jgi:hypothetical protein
MEVERVEIRIGESGDQFFDCPVDQKVGKALGELRDECGTSHGGIYFDQGRRLEQDQTFREQLPTNEDGSLILARLVYKNGKKHDGIQVDFVFSCSRDLHGSTTTG